MQSKLTDLLTSTLFLFLGWGVGHVWKKIAVGILSKSEITSIDLICLLFPSIPLVFCIGGALTFFSWMLGYPKKPSRIDDGSQTTQIENPS